MFSKFSLSSFQHSFSVISILQGQKSISAETDKLAFMYVMNFDVFEKKKIVSFIIFGGLDLCFFDFSFLLEHFSFKVPAC